MLNSNDDVGVITIALLPWNSRVWLSFLIDQLLLQNGQAYIVLPL